MFTLLAGLTLAGCALRRVSYNVSIQFTDPRFSPRMLSNREMAVLPLLTAGGPVTEGRLEARKMVKRLRSLRPDLTFVSYRAFENGFPPRFDKREINVFYEHLFSGDMLAVKSMDSLWAFVRQPYLLVYTLKDGARIQNMDESHFKHVSVVCEIWSRDGRGVVWRASVRGVSDDRRVLDSEILAESMRRLVRSIPAVAPDYGQEEW
ncbi:MAG: hypothetical protein LBC70_06250 [Chitinispirillales bacterium]|nr:hypothetical protein [Chitinispirillales bacterium]